MNSNNRTVQQGFSSASGMTTEERKAMENSITANQAYKNAGGEAGTGLKFTDWLNKQKENGSLDRLLAAAKGIDWKGLFNGKGGAGDSARGGNTFQDPNPPLRTEGNIAPETKILGMPKGVAIAGGIVALSLLGLGLYKIFTKK